MPELLLRLNKQEALVLFKWLAHVESAGTAAFQHPAEEKVLWKLQGQLESVVSEPLAADYPAILAQARRSVELGET